MLIPVETSLLYKKVDVRIHREYKAEFSRVYKFIIDEFSIFDQYPKICKFLFSEQKLRSVNNDYYSRFGNYAYEWKEALKEMTDVQIQKLMYSETYIMPALQRMLTTSNDVFSNALDAALLGDERQREINGDEIQLIHNNNLHFLMKNGRADKIRVNIGRGVINNISFQTTWDKDKKTPNIIILVTTNKFVAEYSRPSLIHKEKEVEAILKNKFDSVVGEFITSFLYKCFAHIQKKSDFIKNSVYMADTVSNFGSIHPEEAFDVSKFPELNEMFGEYVNNGVDKVIDALCKKSEMLNMTTDAVASPKFKNTNELENFMNVFLRKKMQEDMISELEGFAQKVATQIVESVGSQYSPSRSSGGYYSSRRSGEKYYELLLQDFEV